MTTMTAQTTQVYSIVIKATPEQVSGGWPYIVSGLKTLLETGQPLVG